MRLSDTSPTIIPSSSGRWSSRWCIRWPRTSGGEAYGVPGAMHLRAGGVQTTARPPAFSSASVAAGWGRAQRVRTGIARPRPGPRRKRAAPAAPSPTRPLSDTSSLQLGTDRESGTASRPAARPPVIAAKTVATTWPPASTIGPPEFPGRTSPRSDVMLRSDRTVAVGVLGAHGCGLRRSGPARRRTVRRADSRGSPPACRTAGWRPSRSAGAEAGHPQHGDVVVRVEADDVRVEPRRGAADLNRGVASRRPPRARW